MEPTEPHIPLARPADDAPPTVRPGLSFTDAERTRITEVQQARVREVAAAAGLGESAAGALAAQAVDPAAITGAVLRSMVAAGQLDERQVADVRLTANAYQLAGGDARLAGAIRTVVPPGRKESVRSLRDLAGLDIKAWVGVLANAGSPVPEGTTVDGYAEVLRTRVERLYPGDSLRSRLQPAPDRIAADLAAAGDPAAKARLEGLANAHPGLGLEAIIAETNADPRERGARIGERLGALQQLAEANPTKELLSLDLSPGSPDLDGLGLDRLEPSVRTGVLRTIKAQQRIYQLTDNVDDAARLLKAGYTSGVDIAREHIDVLTEAAGFNLSKAALHKDKANRMLSAVVGAFGGLIELGVPVAGVALADAGPTVRDYLRTLDGYEELFGSQAACDCGHCESILGQAAYFADLMLFVERNVTKQYFGGTNAADLLNLQVRRPDLWTTPLTCANTTTLIPSLDIINEILETYVARARGYTGRADDREAVTRVVYGQTLSVAEESLRLPFNLSLERLKVYLEHRETSRDEVVAAVGAPTAVLDAARLGLSTRDYELVTRPNTDLAGLRSIFGLPLVPDQAGRIPPIDAQELLRSMEITRDELTALLATRFVKDSGSVVAVLPEKTDQQSVQNDVERVHNLTAAALDRLHRFIRVWRYCGWSIAELDLALTQAGFTTLTTTELSAVAGLRAVQLRLDLPLDEVCALAGEVPGVSGWPGEASLFERRFDPAPFAAQDGGYPKDTTTFLHPALRAAGATPTAEVAQHRLQGALGVNEAELLTLIRWLAHDLGIDLAATQESGRAFTLTAAHLSVLYRYARLARVVDMPVLDLFRLRASLPQPAHGIGAVAELGALVGLLDGADWWRGSGRTLDDLAVIARRAPLDPTPYPQPTAIVTAIRTDLANDRTLTFADTVFAFLEGLSEESSRKVIEANATRFVRTDDGRYRLADDFDLAVALTAPTSVRLDPAEVRELLANHHATKVLPSQLAGRLRLPVETITTLLNLLQANLNSGAIPAELHGTQAPTALVGLVTDLVPLVVLVSPTKFTSAAVASLATNRAAVGLTDPRQISHATVRALTAVTSAGENVSAMDVLGVLSAYTAADGFGLTDVEALAKVVGVAGGLVPGLLRGLTLAPGTDAATALRQLVACAALALRLGVGGETLALLAATGYDQLAGAADALLAALRSLYPQAQVDEQLEPLDDTLRSRRRDALTDYLIHSSFPQFTTRADLYQHFLIDVELQGCVRTSRVVSAISSLQLYVYRCLMNLEQDRRDPTDLARTHVPPTAVPVEEWSWRKNYRVWEANRKVFLWPENYMQPELRDDKSPLFAELEADLLQKPIDEQSVLDAYATYLAEFEEISRLKITGCYHQKDPELRTDVLHLFGVTPTEPPIFYYRAVRNAHYGVTENDRGTVWEPWRKIDVQIGSRYVSPIVVRGQLHVFWTEWITKPRNSLVAGTSKFTAYEHTMVLKRTTLRLDGRWSAPQRTNLFEVYPYIGDGVYPESVNTSGAAELDPNGLTHFEPREGYRPRGYHWDAVYPFFDKDGKLYIAGTNFYFRAQLDLAHNSVASTANPVWNMDAGRRQLYAWAGTSTRSLSYLTKWTVPADLEQAEFYLDGQRMGLIRKLAFATADIVEEYWGPEHILALPPGTELKVVNGSLEDCIVDTGADQMLLQGSVRAAPGYHISRIGTVIAPELSETLFLAGIDGLLNTEYQRELKEPPLSVSGYGANVDGDFAAGTVDFTGPYGVYYREIFFHIPYLIATHLSSQQRFESAQKWMQYIFDPTANEVITLPPGLTPAERAHRALDRNWRYREFRNRDVDTLRKVLTASGAIEAYLNDPFNPYAIARQRLSAFQRNVVMAYVDNLLDWADSLFAQFSTESVNEATLLYATAAAILGDRPAKLGECGEGEFTPKDYATIEPWLKKGSQFLAELETTILGQAGQLRYKAHQRDASGDAQPLTVLSVQDSGRIALGSNTGTTTSSSQPATAGERASSAQAMTASKSKRGGAMDAFGWNKTRIGRWDVGSRGAVALPEQKLQVIEDGRLAGRFGLDVIHQFSPVFCIPGNPELARRWDRVEEQLFKIRNCLDITGTPRTLALFAPEIDPRLLVRARAAGLSLDDVLGATAGNLPPYRFQFLIDRAKSQAAMVQSFGAALLVARERRDSEELIHLHAVQQQNLLKMATQARQWEIKAAEDAIEAINRQTSAAQLRHGYYQGLAEQNLIPSEKKQVELRNTASDLKKGAAIADLVAAIAHLVPQLGAPTAMKFGGMEVGHSSMAFSDILRMGAGLAEADSAAAGMSAGFERRKDGWLHQVKVISDELAQLEKQLTIAEIRRDIAQRSLDLHQATMDQADEVFAFYGDKFTGLGLYTWLSGTLQRVYREAYNGAYAMARLAEQAFRFERGDDVSDLLAPSYWEASRAGLLAGERLAIDLQTMERRFIETNYRTLEVDQALSLTMVDPAALVKLREKGTCQFTIDDFHYDLHYPGHYRRKVKSVRLTIPCVTGPYSNVSATLTLLGSTIRKDPKLDAASLVEVPLRRSVSIATSTAQQDAGVFEFSFRDERYMPFEGAGAASRWQLTLPDTLRAFDYHTITDVIMHVTYTAEADELFRRKIEATVADAGSLLYRLKGTPHTRVFSLRHDFSGCFQRLMANPLGTAVPFAISKDHFPMYLDGKTLTATAAVLAPVVKRGRATGALQIGLDGTPHAQFAASSRLGDLGISDVTAALTTTFVGSHQISIVNAGSLGVVNPVPGDRSAFDPTLLEDVLLVVDYTAA